MAKKFTIPIWVYFLLAIVILGIVMSPMVSSSMGCPGSQMYCPGVGCVSGQDKCFPGAVGGATKVFSSVENFVNKQCPDGTRSDGPCLMDF
jgi:hypothetical protein